MRDDTLLHDLHLMIQAAMDWDNSHLHQFMHKGDLFGDPAMLDDPRVADYRNVQLGTILRRPKASFKYEYDFGDGWIHQIVLEKILPVTDGMRYPHFLEGKGNSPPEDCGGIYGFMHFVEAIADPKHPDHKHMKEWYGSEYDPAYFDPVVASKRFLLCSTRLQKQR